MEAEIRSAVYMAALAMGSVGLWTLRVALAAAGRKVAGALVAAVEALVFALAFTNLLANLDSPARLIGYAAGVSLGTFAGLRVHDRMTIGHSEVQIAVNGHDLALIGAFHQRGWPAAGFAAEGPDGPVLLVFVAVDDDRVPALLDDVRSIAPQAFWAVQRLQTARTAQLPQDCIRMRVARTPRSLVRRASGARRQGAPA